MSIAGDLLQATEDAVSAQAYAALLALPGIGYVFALPVVKQITQAIISKVVDWALGNTALGLALLWIMANIGYEVSSVESATDALKKMLNDPGAYTKEQSDAIEKEFDDDAVNLIHLSVISLSASNP